MSVTEHKKDHHTSVRCMVITVSDTRDEETDKSGRLIKDYLKEEGHKVTRYVIVKDEQLAIKEAVVSGLEDPSVDAVLTNGGTGMAYRDVTIETVHPLLDKEMTGFGELFRMLSYSEDIGSSAILSRAIAGVSQHTAIFSTPGSSGAVKLAMEKLILPELRHVVKEVKKDI
ncbi:molybdenum cofactor biosynthesis protein B [Pontibacillus sp. HMF3514]|uniref:MogA/MoaB family molybdenum cofactor biosynthesis protein n=1 Tax=Pontibacillus sp. HMF3514 TaxID=2692425 RepID=UPI001320119F|nr:MogA/MoaB family molybdenum cofactor biosynthesis protein [Pontibacillus sp. HMF3514]QHE53257.1 molybdenum cofactor biosynthesis protein [Pontibacillus sp. HMF3514]